MREDVKQCIKIREDFFETYYDIPEGMTQEVETFITEMNDLGERANDAVDFEAKFSSNGMQERLNGLLTRCVPKAYKMTAEDKKHSREVAKEIFKEDRGRIIKEATIDIIESVEMKATSELNSRRIKAMSEAGVLDEYTRATNVIEDGAIVGGFLGRMFKKKK